MNLSLRKCTMDDVDFVVEEICREAVKGHYRAELTTPEGKTTFKHQVIDLFQHDKVVDLYGIEMDFRGYIIEIDEERAGYSMCRVSGKMRCAEIWFFGLTEKYQGKKLSRQLLQKTIEKIGANKTIKARCLPASTQMITLLKKAGFFLITQEDGISTLCNKKNPAI